MMNLESHPTLTVMAGLVPAIRSGVVPRRMAGTGPGTSPATTRSKRAVSRLAMATPP
jgi:hypothetical protein